MYWPRHVDSLLRGVCAERSTGSVARKRKMRSGSVASARTSDTQPLMRSGNRKLGETLRSSLRKPLSQSCSSSQRRVSPTSDCAGCHFGGLDDCSRASSVVWFRAIASGLLPGS